MTSNNLLEHDMTNLIILFYYITLSKAQLFHACLLNIQMVQYLLVCELHSNSGWHIVLTLSITWVQIQLLFSLLKESGLYNPFLLQFAKLKGQFSE
jgi:hypothetical protein